MKSGLSLRQAVFGALALFVATMLAVTGYTLWHLHQHALKTGKELASARARSFEDYLTQSLHVTELAAAYVVPHTQGALQLSDIQRILTTTLMQTPHLRSMSLLDDQGHILVSSNPANVGTAVSLADFLPQTSATPDLLRIGRPWSGRDFSTGVASTPAFPVADGSPYFIPVSKQINLQDKAVFLLVALNPDFFINHILQSFDESQGSIEVLRFDGTLLLDSRQVERAGSVEDYVVRDLKLDQLESGSFVHTPQNSGQDSSQTAYRASRLYPLVVVTHHLTGAALVNWHAQTQAILLVVLPTLLAICLLAIIFYRRQVLHLLKSNADNAERKHIQLLLAEKMRLLGTILDNSSVGITFVRKRQQVWANQHMSEMFGYTLEEMENQSTRMFYPTQQAFDELGQTGYAVLAAGRTFATEVQLQHKNGSLLWVSLSGKAVDAHDPDAGSIWVFDDISEHRRIQHQLYEAKEAAEAANLAKSRFLATMSHEIRTPMNGVLGMAQLLLMPNLDESERQNYVRTILSSGQTLLALLNDILDLSKIEAGKFQLEPVEFDPHQFLAQTCALFDGAAQAKQLKLSCHWHGPSAVHYLCDTHRLHQMLSNLVGNAIKFTPQGSVALSGKELQRKGKMALLEFCVTDTGIGIAADKQDLIYKPFSQADSSITREFGGTGLGLSIVRSLAKTMGGDVGVDSEPGVGSSFWFRIQVQLAIPNQEKTQPPPLLGDTNPIRATSHPLKGRLLVVEDNPVNAMVVESLLKQLGLSSTLATDGAQAVQIITSYQPADLPDLILMDLQMPVMDGYSATQQIRQWEAGQFKQAIPIIALTADAFEEDRQRCLAAGMNDFLTKPVAIEALKSALAKWLPAI